MCSSDLYTGTPSVSEAAALLAAGGGQQPAPMSALVVEKHRLRGPDGRNANCLHPFLDRLLI